MSSCAAFTLGSGSQSDTQNTTTIFIAISML